MGSHHGAVCAPSRAMLMSGRSLFDVYDDLDDVRTFPEALREHDYVTFGTGKWHQSRASFVRSFSQGRDVFFGGMSDHDRVPVQDLRDDGTFTDIEHKSMSTDVFADAAIDFLNRQASAGRPFLAYVSFTTPHDPRTPPEPYRSQYPATAVPLPPNFMPLHPFHNGWMTGRDEQLAAWPRAPGVVQEQLGEYYGLITHIDARVGDILRALRTNGLADNTVVIFASDNGLALGSHGLLGKQSLYEHSNHVPLIVAGPGIPQGETPALVLLNDLYPTIATLTGMEAPDDLYGRDLSGLWQGSVASVRDNLYAAYEDLHRSIREGRWKLIRYPRLGHVQLFDLAADPHELNNLADDPAHLKQRQHLERLLSAAHMAHNDPHPLAVDTLDTMDYDYTTFTRNPDRHQPAWVIEKYFE